MTLHIYIAKQMCLPSINFLHILVSEIQPRQDYYSCFLLVQPTHLPTRLDAMGEINICTAFEGVG